MDFPKSRNILVIYDMNFVEFENGSVTSGEGGGGWVVGGTVFKKKIVPLLASCNKENTQNFTL